MGTRSHAFAPSGNAQPPQRTPLLRLILLTILIPRSLTESSRLVGVQVWKQSPGCCLGSGFMCTSRSADQNKGHGWPSDGYYGLALLDIILHLLRDWLLWLSQERVKRKIQNSHVSKSLGAVVWNDRGFIMSFSSAGIGKMIYNRRPLVIFLREDSFIRHWWGQEIVGTIHSELNIHLGKKDKRRHWTTNPSHGNVPIRAA